jgi:hypothetical protein
MVIDGNDDRGSTARQPIPILEMRSHVTIPIRAPC